MKVNLTKACLEGGFHLLKWKSNVAELNDPVPTPPPPPTNHQEPETVESESENCEEQVTASINVNRLIDEGLYLSIFFFQFS